MGKISDLRSFLQVLEDAGQLVRIQRPVCLSYELADVYQLVDQIKADPKVEITKRTFPLWLTWPFFGGVVGLLLGEWLLRKWVNLQ